MNRIRGRTTSAREFSESFAFVDDPEAVPRLARSDAIMWPEGPHRRARRTRKRLFDALVALIREKEYPSITVTEIAERADVARATFYLHYDDKDALLLSWLDDLFERIVEEEARFSVQDLVLGTPHPALAIFGVVQHDPDLFRVILNGQGGARMLERFRRFAADAAHQALRGLGEPNGVPRSVVADFVAGALLSVATGWLDNGMRTAPEQMAAMFYRLVRPSLLGVLPGGTVRPIK